jgi:large repetitive protein
MGNKLAFLRTLVAHPVRSRFVPGRGRELRHGLVTRAAMCSLLTLLGAFLVRDGLSTTPSAASGAPTDTATTAPRAQYEPGIVSEWRFDEGSGSIATDSIRANNGTIEGAPWSTGIVGDALSFDGDDRVLIPDNPSLDPSTITVETWVKLDRIAYGPGVSGTDSQFLISKGGDGTTGAYILTQWGPNSSSSSFAFEIGPWPGWIAGTPFMTLETGRWYHVAGTYDGNTVKIYLDGVLQGSEDVGSIQVGNSSPLYFGYNDVGGYPYYLDGSLDEVAIFSRALTALEIQRHYQNGLNNPVGGIAEYPQLEPEAAATRGGPSGPNNVALAGAAGGAVLLLVAGGWCARRRWLH